MTLDALAFGYGMVEGPCVDDVGGLYFSDLAGGVHRLGPDGKVTVIVPKRRMVGGIALHADGGIVISGRSLCHVNAGVTRELAHPPDGMIFNDLFCDSAGRVYVGSVASPPGSRFGGLHRVETDGEVVTLCGDVGIPNGIGMSADGTRLFHVDSAKRQVFVQAIDVGGHVGDPRVFIDLSLGEGADFGFPPAHPTPDGLAIDEAGGVWVAMLNGSSVQRFTQDGDLDITIDVPARLVTSLAFGGDDRRTLYIVSGDNTDDPGRGGTVFRTRSPCAGVVAPCARL